MDKTYSQLAEEHNIIRKEVEDNFGRKIKSSRDCIVLSEAIHERTQVNINPNTLRRFYGLVKADYPPSKATITILAKFCGFNSVEELVGLRGEGRKSSDLLNADEVLKLLTGMYESTPVRDYNDETFLHITRQVVQFLQSNPELADKFQRIIAKTPNGQNYYFEQFVHIDGLNGYFGEGLRYYLNEKRDMEAQVFGHSLLCLKGWFSDDAELVRRHHDEVLKFNYHSSLHPFVQARYFATQIYHADIFGESVEKILLEARSIHSTIKPGKMNYRAFPAFEYVLSSCLLVTQHFNEALHYVNYALRNYPEKLSYVDEGYYHSLHMLKALCLCELDKKDEAVVEFEKVRPAKFYFMTKKLSMFFYLIMERHLNKNSARVNEQLDQLLIETGYRRLYRKFVAETESVLST